MSGTAFLKLWGSKRGRPGCAVPRIFSGDAYPVFVFMSCLFCLLNHVPISWHIEGPTASSYADSWAGGVSFFIC